MNKLAEEFLRLVEIMDELREKCPWDREQTVETLRSMTIEETYELADAVTEKNWKGIKEELGDLLLHILFYSKIANEQHQFTLEEVIQGISEKLITRHPHIYGDIKVDNEEDVKKKLGETKTKRREEVSIKWSTGIVAGYSKSFAIAGKSKAGRF